MLEIGDNGTKRMFDALSLNTSITTLSIRGKLLPNLDYLTFNCSLSLEQNSGSSQVGKGIAKLIATNTTITNLDISGINCI